MDKPRVLLIDDEVVFTRLLKTYLEGTGHYDVRVVNTGAQALAAVRQFRPDVILLDVIMPDLDGSHIAAELKADESLRQIPIVFLTAVVSREEADARSGCIGGHFFLAKPASAKEVLACIERCVRGESASRPVSSGA